jgi:hypothetical protein
VITPSPRSIVVSRRESAEIVGNTTSSLSGVRSLGLLTLDESQSSSETSPRVSSSEMLVAPM